MDYSSLHDLICAISQGTKLNIAVQSVNLPDCAKTRLPHLQTIHASPVCTHAKSLPGGFARCFQCRNAALQRAADTLKPFSGFCVNGVYEYCHPVVEDGQLLCVICIGNIYRDNPRFPAGQRSFVQTMETEISDDRCRAIGAVIESYLRMLWKEYPRTASAGHPLKTVMRAFVEENLACELQLKTLAELLHYHEKYLGRLFRQEFGMHFHRYVISRRLELASRLLCQSNEKVTQIAARTGFNSVSFFNREFRKVYGMTPTQYRMLSGQSR